MKEDFKDVAFTKKEGTKDEYLLTCIGKNGRPLQTSFRLDSFEAELLQKQLEALTAPVPSPGMTDEDKAQLQFNHLRRNTMAIACQFGPLAAFYTSLVKWKDRFENLCTYWKWDHQNGKRRVEAESFLRKLRESHYYFTAVEADAMDYLAVWVNLPSTMSTQEKEAYSRFIAKTRLTFHSVVSFCEILFFGGTYEELLTKSAKQYLEERNDKAKIKDKKRRQDALRALELKYLFFLPTLGPLPQPTRFF